jgi:hypothetical protein
MLSVSEKKKAAQGTHGKKKKEGFFFFPHLPRVLCLSSDEQGNEWY